MGIATETYPLSVAFSPDGDLVAIGTNDKTVIIFNFQRLKVVQELPFDYSIYAVEWSPDGKYLAIGGIDGPILILQVNDWSIKKTLPDSDGAMNLSWSNDSQYLAVGSWSCSDTKKAEVWLTSNWTRLETNNDYLPRYVHFSPDSMFLAITYKLDGIEILSVPDFKRIALLDFSDSDKYVDIYSPFWSENGLFIAASCGDGRTRIWRTSDWSIIHTILLHGYWEDAEYRVAFSPDNRFLISGGFGTPKLVSVATGREIYEFKNISTEDVLAFSWHPSSKYVAIIDQHDHAVNIFEIESQ